MACAVVTSDGVGTGCIGMAVVGTLAALVD